MAARISASEVDRWKGKDPLGGIQNPTLFFRGNFAPLRNRYRHLRMSDSPNISYLHISGGGIRNSRTGRLPLARGTSAWHLILPAQNSRELGPLRVEREEGKRRGREEGRRRRGRRGEKETGELPLPLVGDSSTLVPSSAPQSQLRQALTSFARVLVIYRLRFVLFVPIKSVIIIEASADPQLPGENNTRDHQPQKHPRGERLQTHPPPLEEGGDQTPRAAWICGALGTVLFSPLGGSSERPECSGVRRHAGVFRTLERANAAWLPRMLGNLARDPRVGGRQVRSSAQGSRSQPGTVQVVLPAAELPAIAIATGRGERRTAGSAATGAPAPAPRPRRCQDPAAERELQPPAPAAAAAAAAAPGR